MASPSEKSVEEDMELFEESEEGIRENKRPKVFSVDSDEEDLDSEFLSPSEIEFILQYRGKNAKKSKIAESDNLDKNEGGTESAVAGEQNGGVSASFNPEEGCSRGDVLVRGSREDEKSDKNVCGKADKSNNSNCVSDASCNTDKGNSSRGDDVSVGRGGEDDKMLEGGFEYDKKTQSKMKRDERCERRREQLVRNAEARLRDKLFGKNEVKNPQEKSLIVSIENKIGTINKVETSSSRFIINALEKYVSPEDIKEVRCNKKKQRATIEINMSSGCLPTSKTFIESLERGESMDVVRGDQVFWSIKKIDRSSIGVIRGVPMYEDKDDIIWYCKREGLEVKEVRKLGPTVLSIQFKGPLPDNIMFPFSYKNRATKVEPYFTGSKRCMKCLGFGHLASTCKGPLCCAKCGGHQHVASECRGGTPKCPNCGGVHSPLWNECPIKVKHQKAKNVLIAKKKSEEREIERDALHGLLGASPGTNTSPTGEGLLGEERSEETDVLGNEFVLRKLEQFIEDKLSAFHNIFKSIFEKIEEKIVKISERVSLDSSPMTSRNNEVEIMTRSIETSLREKLEDMMKNVIEKGMRQSRSMSPQSNKVVRGRGGVTGKKT